MAVLACASDRIAQRQSFATMKAGEAMPRERPFRFGVQFGAAVDRAQWKERAIQAEAFGYDVFIMPDHLDGQFAIGPALAVVAESTSTLHISTLVLQNELRHPALVAMEAATLDVLSDGRFELGLGAGGSWMPDYEWTGIPFPSPGVRLERLEETISIVKGLFADGPLTFDGNHYTITEFDGLPKPVQHPRLPILIGGGGPRLLSIAAREADIISIFPSMLPAGGRFREAELAGDAFARKIDLLRRVAGDRFPDIELNVLAQVVAITDDRELHLAQLSRQWNVPIENLANSPQILVGTVAEIADHLRDCRARLGISYYVIFSQHMEIFAPVIALLAGK